MSARDSSREKYSTDSRVLMVIFMVQCNEKIKAVQRAWRAHFHTGSAPDPRTIGNVFEKFKRTGSVLDDRVAMSAGERTVNTEENRQLLEDLFLTEQSVSLRRAAARLQLSLSTIQRMVKSLNLTPYKIQITQPLNENHEERRLQFAITMLEKIHAGEIDPNKIWFTDEAWFTLDGYVNKQNMRHWDKQRSLSFDNWFLFGVRSVAVE